ncbi:class I SAM-dependent methyltransferase [Priestia megaterium]|uniref:class I SAM-dependent methyltransferase n=1 Tax=Priestia megaterium TaxID=1404 RepID=UPI0023636279|nr:class I SAM-dependent methyltransferase [Priestia megaterium]MDD1510590.1 class I SAM-dependent methyltransferase [Priestia megaterium]
MKIERILPFARTLLTNAVAQGDVAIDATAGNGHDTLFLANLVGDTGYVYGFDIQPQAIQATQQRLTEHHVENRVTLIQESHSNINMLPRSIKGRVTGAVFNLGYLPGGDKDIVTTSETTISAIEQLLDLLAPEGVIVLVIYHGHEQGKQERDDLLTYVQNLDQKDVHVLQYRFMNQQNNPPFIIAIEKR